MNASLNDPATTVYVGNLDPKVTKAQLYELFVQLSPISRIRYPKDKILQLHQGYAFVEFYTPEDCQYVAQLMNNTVYLYDRALKVRPANAQLSSNSSSVISVDVNVLPIAKVFVKNLDNSIDENQLTKIFTKYGPLSKSSDVFHLSNGQLRCAYIYFKFYDDADTAISSLNCELLANKKISLDYAFKDNVKGNVKYGGEVDRLLNKEARKNGILK
ncbi:hypothetical protein HG535_0F00710 [Zygotorulaspora mrakii]|uniref:RRM domain-containing protein n=1 Tax=Zygotorulaspora mrakii TaxID=42260 RepID=A0A7H9B4E3_ZYGMR|nr:uncharacterized protein HG535_0F00710 [Zygotorulaspora mrakii]QLG73561.1 hypothetical protein HG535_0F00710 [Zygotorulaspora mrakii]